MKTLYLFILLIIASISGNSQPIMLIQPDTIDFGQVEYSSEQSRIAMIYNTGDEPLLINGIISSCGCTVPSWTTQPINPEDSSEIVVRYSTYSLGRFIKAVTVYSNDTLNSPKRITVIGEVIMSTGTKQFQDGEFALFPNPSTGIINIKGLNHPAEVRIMSIQGQDLKTVSNVEGRIDLSDLKPGLYVLKLKSGNKEIIRKIVIER